MISGIDHYLLSIFVSFVCPLTANSHIKVMIVIV